MINCQSKNCTCRFDKPYYYVGDTIWFKGYILNSRLNYSPLSGRVYIDLVNDSSVVVKRLSFASALGVTLGNISLDYSQFREGGYTIRAYTTWMRNFGEESFFYKSFFLSDPVNNPWIIATDAKPAAASKNSIEASFKFTGIDEQPIANRDLDVKLMNGKKTLFSNKLNTGSDGILRTNFNLPDNQEIKNLTLVTTDKKDNKKREFIPVNINRVQDVDLQFMPEGGQFVAGLPANLGFKAIGEDGLGVYVKGVILDKAGNEIVNFEASHNGMGMITMIPQAGETYIAKITLAGEDTKTVNLPTVKTVGTVLHIKNVPAADSLTVSILTLENAKSANKLYRIIAESRGVVCYGASFSVNGNALSTRIAKSIFPTGIIHFTIFNEQDQPVNERLIFLDHHDNLKIDIKTGKSYNARDSIAMGIKVTDDTGKPVVGSFSVAVTDNNQVKNEPGKSTNILTCMLLSSELKGYVEDAPYYFSKKR